MKESEIVLEQYDNYSKQTYRNRCLIMGPNGVIALSIPVIRKRGVKTLMRDIRVDYDSNWNKIHWRSLVASYAASPYFEFLADELYPCYHRNYDYLIDLNQDLIDNTLGFLGLDIPVIRTDEFTPVQSQDDPRHFIHPKKNQARADPGFHPMEYQQVFSDRLGFRSNLSFLDLIFNMGPEALSYLHTCLKT